MDPIGLGFENYDAIGRWRDADHGQAIDASGEINGESFTGPTELLELLRGRERDIAANFVARLMTYAIGRGLRPVDQCAVDKIVDGAVDSRYQMSELIMGVVTSRPVLDARRCGVKGTNMKRFQPLDRPDVPAWRGGVARPAAA